MDVRVLQRSTRRRAGAAAVLAGCLALTAPAAARARDINLLLNYTVRHSCAVHPNYPRRGVRDNDIGWTIAPGDVVTWRYNASRLWAMVSDRNFNDTAHPWWGFVKMRCIGRSIGGEHFPTATSSYPAGRPVPKRRRQGRSTRPGLSGARRPQPAGRGDHRHPESLLHGNAARRPEQLRHRQRRGGLARPADRPAPGRLGEGLRPGGAAVGLVRDRALHGLLSRDIAAAASSPRRTA